MHLFSIPVVHLCLVFFFFFNDTATTEIYTLSLHDALPISGVRWKPTRPAPTPCWNTADRKSTRLNSSHVATSYAVFCLKKKKKKKNKLKHKKKKKKKKKRKKKKKEKK